MSQGEREFCAKKKFSDPYNGKKCPVSDVCQKEEKDFKKTNFLPKHRVIELKCNCSATVKGQNGSRPCTGRNINNMLQKTRSVSRNTGLQIRRSLCLLSRHRRHTFHWCWKALTHQKWTTDIGSISGTARILETKNPCRSVQSFWREVELSKHEFFQFFFFLSSYTACAKHKGFCPAPRHARKKDKICAPTCK